MSQCFDSCDSLLWIGYQHFLEQVHAFRFDVLVEGALQLEIHLLVFLVDLVIPLTLKECFLCEQDMEYNSQGKDIAFWFHMLTVSHRDDLGGNKTWRSAPSEEIFLLIGMTRQSKVNNDRFQRKGILAHNVLRFEITMGDPVLMHLRHS